MSDRDLIERIARLEEWQKDHGPIHFYVSDRIRRAFFREMEKVGAYTAGLNPPGQCTHLTITEVIQVILDHLGVELAWDHKKPPSKLAEFSLKPKEVNHENK